MTLHVTLSTDPLLPWQPVTYSTPIMLFYCHLMASVWQHNTFTHCRVKVGPPSPTLAQRWVDIGLMLLGRMLVSCAEKKQSGEKDTEGGGGGVSALPANTRRQPNVGLMLAHRLRRWPNINSTLGQRVVFAGLERDRVAQWSGVGHWIWI